MTCINAPTTTYTYELKLYAGFVGVSSAHYKSTSIVTSLTIFIVLTVRLIVKNLSKSPNECYFRQVFWFAY